MSGLDNKAIIQTIEEERSQPQAAPKKWFIQGLLGTDRNIGTGIMPKSFSEVKERIGAWVDQYKDLQGGKLSAIPKAAGNIAWFGFDLLSKLARWDNKESLKQAAQVSRNIWNAGATGAQMLYGSNPESAMTKLGQFWGTAALSFLPTWAAWIAGKVWSIPKIANVAKQAPLAANIIKWSAVGLAEWAKFDVLSEWKLTKNTVLWGVVGGALPIVGKGLSVAGKWLKNLATWASESLQLQGLMNPAKVNMLSQQIQKDGWKAPLDIGKWMLDRNIKGSKETIVETLLQRAEKSRKAVDDSLASIQWKLKSDVAKKALIQTYQDIKKVAWLEDEARKVRTMIKQGKYSLTELNTIKRTIDDQYNLYTKSGDPTAGLKAKGLQNIRKSLRSTIENEARRAGIGNIAALNNETQIARWLADAIKRKDAADAVRSALSMFAPWGVGWLLGYQAWPFDNATTTGRIWNVIFGTLVGAWLGSTRVKTNVASLLAKLWPKEKSALDLYMKTQWKSPLPTRLLQSVDDIIESTPQMKPQPQQAVRNIQKPSVQQGVKSVKPLQTPQSPTKSLVSQPQRQPTQPKTNIRIPWKKLKTNADIIPSKAIKQEMPKTPMKSALPMSQKSNVVYSKPDLVSDIDLSPIVTEAKKYKSIESFKKALKTKVWSKEVLKKLKPVFEWKSQREIWDILESIFLTWKLPTKKASQQVSRVVDGIDLENIPF